MSTPPKLADLREAIAELIWAKVSAPEAAAFCVGIGLEPERADEDGPWSGKKRYVRTRIQHMRLDQLIDLARRLLEEWDDVALQNLIDGTPGGAAGEVKNLIFASTGPKPQIVLRDALTNTAEITKYADTCLVYERRIPDSGLTWSMLVDWWTTQPTAGQTGDEPARELWQRLRQSLDQEPEQLLFSSYSRRYTDPETSALIPQVYLHYDPYLRRTGEARPGVVWRQRMDFLLLLPRRRRVVIEIDGRHHYAAADGQADPAQYARMVAEDRRLRLAGYDVYRFGGAEFTNRESADEVLTMFFDQLLAEERPDHL